MEPEAELPPRATIRRSPVSLRPEGPNEETIFAEPDHPSSPKATVESRFALQTPSGSIQDLQANAPAPADKDQGFRPPTGERRRRATPIKNAFEWLQSTESRSARLNAADRAENAGDLPPGSASVGDGRGESPISVLPVSVVPDEHRLAGEVEAEGFLYFRCGSAGLVPAAKATAKAMMGVPYQKRWFFVRGGVLCHARTEGSAHAESLVADKTVMCGQVIAVDITSQLRYEFSVFAGGRKYAMRADTKVELDMWHEVCNRNGRMWLQTHG